MTGFLTGTFTALVLAVATWFALNEFSQTAIQRVYNPSLNLEGLDQNYSPLMDTNREGIAGRD
ncbi:hypothetical protein [Citreimonas salinaria]|uniref:Uncharacterized protein n=1 Tax=Citreimonas salinaria TaxID=321339 RepID=A0A1H3KAF5_9RHOB|nr:hypothetical protein [Citreimonas salinaria]SDY49131.1 hypothetical protein SAMN05444340_10921 [Citreimonas salinaria]